MSSRLRIVRRRHFSVPLLVQIASRIGPRLPSLVCREQIEIIGGVLDACAQPFQGRPWRSFVMGPSSPPPTMGGCHTQPQLVEHVRQRADDLLHLQPDDVSSGSINVKQPCCATTATLHGQSLASRSFGCLCLTSSRQPGVRSTQASFSLQALG